LGFFLAKMAFPRIVKMALSLARIIHEQPAANANRIAIAARNAETPDCGMSIQLHRRFTVSTHTDGTLHVFTTTLYE
jgi:hypothetical protein